MSWLYSQALVAEFSEENCSNGEPSAQLNTTLMPQAYLYKDKTTESWSRFPSGMTCEPLTETRGKELLMLFQEAFRAKTSALREKAQELPERDLAYGEKWPELLAKLDQNTFLWKTAQCSLFEDSEPSLQTFPKWGTMRNGELLERIMPEHLTSETGSGYWPAPDANMGEHGTQPEWTPKRKSGHQAQYTINQAVRDREVFPTPVARMWKDNGKSQSELNRNSETLATIAGGRLNPDWVEWLMGWPIGWTDLKPLETDKFQQWLNSHGIY